MFVDDETMICLYFCSSTTQKRKYSFLPDLTNPITALTDKNKEFSEQRIIGINLKHYIVDATCTI